MSFVYLFILNQQVRQK